MFEQVIQYNPTCHLKTVTITRLIIDCEHTLGQYPDLGGCLKSGYIIYSGQNFRNVSDNLN